MISLSITGYGKAKSAREAKKYKLSLMVVSHRLEKPFERSSNI